MGVQNISKGAVNMKLLDTWQWQIHTSYAHAQGKFILLDRHGKFTGCTEIFTGCTVDACRGNLLDAWLQRVHALYARAHTLHARRQTDFGP